MWKPHADRWGVWLFWTVIVLGALERIHLLCVFGFRYIGIDDALIQQMAVDYGNGTFREPFLYGQNYNPMLEALLAAPFVRLGGAPWIVLPIVTSFLALIPYWSFALWSRKRGWLASSLVFAALPILLPVEWGMITSMSRGFVHGIALLALVPWFQELKHPLLKHASTSLVLCAALFCNPNTLPLVAGIGAWLITRYSKSALFWCMSVIPCAVILLLHLKAQTFFDNHPLVHPLIASDLAFRWDLLWSGLRNLDRHFLHVNPFGGGAIVVLFGLAFDVFTTWRLGQRTSAFALLIAVIVTTLALGVLKVHEGCESVFFAKSRMFLSLPLLMGVALALYLKAINISKLWVFPVVLAGLVVTVVVKAMNTEEVIQREIAQQSCAFVREEPLAVIRDRCRAIKAEADAQGADLVVPIRWPGIYPHHQAHFVAHFICYACEQLVSDFPPVYGIGYDRRSWLASRYGSGSQGRVLFVGGDTAAWARALAEGRSITDVSVARTTMHTAQCDSMPIGTFLLELGVDDDLGR